MQSNYIENHDFSKVLRYLPYKYKLACNVAFWTGWRIDDVLNLKTKNISGTKIKITERKTKKNSERELQDWQISEMLHNSSGGLIFPGNKKNRPIARQTLWRQLKRACERSGVNPNGFSAHSIRKLWAVNQLQQKKSVLEIQRLMNHKYLSTTMIYCFSDQL